MMPLLDKENESRNKKLDVEHITIYHKQSFLKYHTSALHFFHLPWPHLGLVSQPKVVELAVPPSYSNLHKILVYPGKEVGIHWCPLLQNPSTLGRASSHRQGSHILHLLPKIPHEIK